MANPEHLALLLSEEWNAWRTRNGNVTPDLTDSDFSGKDLSGNDVSVSGTVGITFANFADKSN